jgi:transcriptional regulator with XRE-family HTH domain
VAKEIPLHERVHAHAIARGLSNAEIAKRTGWHELRVWRLLTGRTDLSAEDMKTLARVFDLSVAELYGEHAA